MRFSSTRFDRHIANMGQMAQWRRAWACSCVNASSGAPDPKCRLCSGKGWFWDAPIDTVLGVPSQETYIKQGVYGAWEDGDMMITIPQSSDVWALCGRFDRVLMLNSTDVFSQPLTRGSPTEKLNFNVSTIHRVFWRNPTSHAPVEGGIPTIGTDGRPTWEGGIGEPPPGTSYSITGEKFSEYYILDQLPSDRNEHSGTRLPKRVKLRKWDLFGR